MKLPVLRRTRTEIVERPSDTEFKKALGAVLDGITQVEARKGFLDGNAATLTNRMPGTSWSNQGTISNALLARVTQNLASSFQRAPAELEAALAEYGLSWGPPFPPGRPLDPFWGYRRPPRTEDFSVGENVQLTPRWNRISFGTLKSIIDSYYAAQICIRHLINDVRSLDYQFVPPQNIAEDASEDIQKAEEFFASPDKRQPFRTWLAEYLQDVLRYDAGTLFIRRNNAQEPIALEVVSGTTLIPLIDFFGRPPADELDENADPEGIWGGDIVPAFVQIIQGLPWGWHTLDDIIYQRINPLPESQYGLAPMEAVLLQANTDIRFQWHFLQYFTEGTIPAGFMEAPPDLSDPQQVALWQETWEQTMLNDQSRLRQVRWVPGGAKFTPVKETAFDKEFPLYLMRCTAAAFGVNANDLGFTEDVNRACYSEDTEVLTWNGWKRYCEVGPSERIATLNPDTQGIEYHVPDKLLTYDFDGEMVHFESRQVDVLVTPEHRMWVRRRRTGTRLPVWEKAEAASLGGRGPIWFADSGTFDGGVEIDQFLIPTAERGRTANHLNEHGDRLVPMDRWLEFVGYVVSEGCIFGDGADGRYRLSLSQNVRVNPEKCRAIQDCLDALPFRFAFYDGDDDTRRWQVSDKALWTCLRDEVGRFAADKHLPRIWRSLGKRQLSILFEALMLGDGTTDKRPRCTGRTYYTKSERLAGEVQEIALRLGYRAAVRPGTRCLRVLMSEPRGFEIHSRNVTRERYVGKVWCFHVRNHLFFTRRNGKVGIHGNTGEVQVDVQFRVGTLPVVRHVEDVINLFILEHLKLKARIQFDTGQGTQHRYEIAQADQLLIDSGVISPDEARMSRGYRVSRERPVTRFINNTRAGPIPLVALDSLAGKVDYMTFGPTKDQPLIDHPYFSAPGVNPVIGSDDYKGAQDSTANMQANLVTENADPRASGKITRSDGVHSGPQPDALARQTRAAQAPKEPDKTEKALADAIGIIDTLLEVIQKEGTPDNTGGPGVTRGFSNPTTITDGIMVDTGLQGVDLLGPKLKRKEEDEEDEESEAAKVLYKEIRRWRENALNRVRKGQPPRRFDDLPSFIVEPIWDRLNRARTREEVIAAFSGDILVPKAEGRKALDREAAGIAVQALDTGRVLMVQRQPDKHDPGEAYARWEFPGGRLDDSDESIWAGAVREWSEETGATLPVDCTPVGGWVSDDGVYEGFVVRIPREASLSLNPQPEEVSNVGWCDPEDLDDPVVRDKVTEQLGDIEPILKAEWSDFHRHTNRILDHYTPLIQDSMAQIVEADTIQHAMRAAYQATKQSVGGPTSPGTQNTPKYAQNLAALTGVAPIVAGTGAGALGAAAAGVAAIVASLTAAPAAVMGLGVVLAALYGDAILQGSHEAAKASGGPVLPGVEGLGLPADFSEAWRPGFGGAAAAMELEDGDLAKLLRQANVTIKGVTDTELRRIGDAIAEGVREGFPMPQTAQKVDAIIHDAKRAALIAETEYSRAMTAAARATYLRNGVPEVQWLHQPDACPLCMDNAAASPIQVGASWPNGDVPVHPNCRCAEAPVVRVPRRS